MGQNQIGAIGRDNLIGGSQMPIVDGMGTISGGQGLLKRGTALAIDEDKKLSKLVAENTTDNIADNTADIYCILAENKDSGASGAADVDALIYLTGEFNENSVDFGEVEKDDVFVYARKIGIFFRRGI